MRGERMQTDYSDQDTARVRQTEASSAGQPTRQLAHPSGESTSAGAMPPSTDNTSTAPLPTNNLAALALIAVGTLMLLGRFTPDPGGLMAGMILLTIASCFLFFGFWKHIYGLVIPGSILGGLSMGIAFADVTNGVSIVWGLAVGFLSLFFVGRALFAQHSQWPIYPATILFAVGTIIAMANAPALFAGLFIWLPVLLIVAGLYLGWRRTAH